MKARSKYHRFGGLRAHRAAVEGVPAPAGAPIEETRGPRQVIEQAARDISRGLRDTDLHGTPANVPGPGAPPENSPGAEVPPAGVDVRK